MQAMTENAYDNKKRRRVSVRMWIGALACAAAVTLWTALPVAAHHSFAAEFDSTKPRRSAVTARRVWFLRAARLQDR
jgi:hypothetical protein